MAAPRVDGEDTVTAQPDWFLPMLHRRIELFEFSEGRLTPDDFLCLAWLRWCSAEYRQLPGPVRHLKCRQSQWSHARLRR